MSWIFDSVIELSEKISERLEESGSKEEVKDPRFPWRDSVYHGRWFRRGHLNIVDARETRNLYMMHCCIFPNLADNAPIYGLDIIAGPSRISGAFHDFSATGNSSHHMMRWFTGKTGSLSWNKPRELPEWARAIFSPSMIAAGAINSEVEIKQLIRTSLDTLEYYLDNVGFSVIPGVSYVAEQNRYCHYQKQNPHNPRVMQSLGLSEADAHEFVDKIMFPEIA
jgi:hypothetical protein